MKCEYDCGREAVEGGTVCDTCGMAEYNMLVAWDLWCGNPNHDPFKDCANPEIDCEQVKSKASADR